jgi:hypothetical protein
MKTRQSQMYRMLVRVRDFGAAQKSRFPEASLADRLFDTVGPSVQQVEQHAVIRTNALRSTTKSKAEARAALDEALAAMSLTARSIEAVEPSFVNKFQLPRRRSADAMLTAARAFLDHALPNAEILAAHALPIEEFAATVARFEAAVRSRDAGKELNVDAKARIATALDAGMKAARQLDAMVRNHFKADKPMIAMWEQVRYVSYQKPGAKAAATLTNPQLVMSKAA